MAPSKKHLKNLYPMNRGKLIKFVRDIDWCGVWPKIPKEGFDHSRWENSDDQWTSCVPKENDAARILSRTKNGWLKVKTLSDEPRRHGRIIKIRNMPDYVDSMDRIRAAKKSLDGPGNQGIWYDHEKGKLMGTEDCEPGGEHILFKKEENVLEESEKKEQDRWVQIEENVQQERVHLLLELQQENDALKIELAMVRATLRETLLDRAQELSKNCLWNDAKVHDAQLRAVREDRDAAIRAVREDRDAAVREVVLREEASLGVLYARIKELEEELRQRPKVTDEQMGEYWEMKQAEDEAEEHDSWVKLEENVP